MPLTCRKPKPPLDQFVECFWLSLGYSPSHQLERVLPTGTVELVFDLRNDRIRIFDDEFDEDGRWLSGAVVTGAQSRYFVLETSQQAFVVGVHFRPGGAAPFFQLPLGEIMDQHVSLEDLWGKAAHELRERLQDAKTPSSIFALLEDALLERLREPPHHRLVALAIQQISVGSTSVRVREVSDSTGYSQKRFIRLFHNQVGLTPKLFGRVQRFQWLLDQINRGANVDWVRVALDAGYFDQSHMIRDFRAFTGVSPVKYQAVEPDRKNHMTLNR
jgi:AraC-like DNA-binding protein